MVFQEASEQQAAEVGARFEAWLLQQEDLTPTEAHGLRVIGNQLRANADIMNEFTPGRLPFTPLPSWAACRRPSGYSPAKNGWRGC